MQGVHDDIQITFNTVADDIQRKIDFTRMLKSKAAQAESDKIELMRDLATYECNFSKETNVQTDFLRIHKMVADTRMKINKIKTHKEETWFDPSLSSKIIEAFSTLKFVQ